MATDRYWPEEVETEAAALRREVADLIALACARQRVGKDLLADALQISRATLYRYLSGERWPPPDVQAALKLLKSDRLRIRSGRLIPHDGTARGF